jgi:hypothetical protein
MRILYLHLVHFFDGPTDRVSFALEELRIASFKYGHKRSYMFIKFNLNLKENKILKY